MELVLTLPILGVALLGMFEMSWLFYSRTLVVEASRAGARYASISGADPDGVDAEVRRILPARFHEGLTVRTLQGEEPGDLVTVGVEVPMAVAAPDLLWPIGMGLAGRNLYSETRMARE